MGQPQMRKCMAEDEKSDTNNAKQRAPSHFPRAQERDRIAVSPGRWSEAVRTGVCAGD